MFKFVFLVAALIATGNAYTDNSNPLVQGINGRIVGGSETTITKHPWQVSLQYNGNHYCGGTIISEDTIITAAHCTDGFSLSKDKIVAGTTSIKSGGVTMTPKSVTNHASYSSTTLNNDIAIIKLSTKLTWSDSIKPAGLPTQGEELSSGSSVVVTGWGTTSEGGSTLPTNLREVTVGVIARNSCQSSYSGTGQTITTGMLCAGVNGGGKDACQGDSGGPLVRNGILYGVVSWGYGCARAQYPGVYTNVANYRSWIQSNANV